MKEDYWDSDEDKVAYGDPEELARHSILHEVGSVKLDWKTSFDGISGYRQLRQEKKAVEEGDHSHSHSNGLWEDILATTSNTKNTSNTALKSVPPQPSSLFPPALDASQSAGLTGPPPPPPLLASSSHHQTASLPNKKRVVVKPVDLTNDRPSHWSQTNKLGERLALQKQKKATAAAASSSSSRKRNKTGSTSSLPETTSWQPVPILQTADPTALTFSQPWLLSTGGRRTNPQGGVAGGMMTTRIVEEDSIVNDSPAFRSRPMPGNRFLPSHLTTISAATSSSALPKNVNAGIVSSIPPYEQDYSMGDDILAVDFQTPRKTSSTPIKHRAPKVGSLRWRLQKLQRESEAVDTYFSALAHPSTSKSLLATGDTGLQDPRNRAKQYMVGEVREIIQTTCSAFFALLVSVEEINRCDSTRKDHDQSNQGACDDLAEEMEDIESRVTMGSYQNVNVGENAVVLFQQQSVTANLQSIQIGQHIKVFDAVDLPLTDSFLKRSKHVARWVTSAAVHSILLCSYCWEML